MGQRTSPAAEAVERLLEAAQYWIDGPGEAARLAAIAMQQPNFGAAEAAAHLASVGLTTAKAWGISAVAWGDAIAILSEEPRGFEHHEVAVADVGYPAYVSVSTAPIQWIPLFGAEPQPLPVVQPNPTTPPGTAVRVESSPISLILAPAQPVTLCRVELIIQPVAGAPTTRVVRLDASTLRTT